MKKILFLQDILTTPPASILSSVVNFVRSDHSFVKVLFLHRSSFFANLPNYGEPGIPVAEPPSTISPRIVVQSEKTEDTDRQHMERNLQSLNEVFTLAGIKFSFSEEVISVPDIVKHSAYADLILADALINFAYFLHAPLNVSVKELLADAHCPVLLLREGKIPPDRIILFYDGSYSSIYAIKCFSYLFPGLRHLPTYIVNATPHEGNDGLENYHYLKDWLPLHFDDFTIEVLSGKVPDILTAYVSKLPGSNIVVMGAYGRTALSRLFRQSLANSILEKTDASLFATHE